MTGVGNANYAPPRGADVGARLMWVRELAQRDHGPSTMHAVLQLADLVQDLYEWRDAHDRDTWDGSTYDR